jgi:hypothetical protein
MDRENILNAIAELAQSQGFYGRLLRDLREAKDENPEGYEAFMTELEAQEFGSTLDLVLYLET